MDELSLYQRVLGDDFQRLDPLLRRFHGSDSGRAFGRLNVIRPGRWWAPLVAWACGFPAAGHSGLRLEVQPVAGGQKWVRWFGSRRLVTTQSAGASELLERDGLLTLAFAMQVRWGGLTMKSQRAWFCGVPLARSLCPRVTAAVRPDPQGWLVRVRIRLPWLGEITRYEGRVMCHDCVLEPAAGPGSARCI